ncbi:MAG: hypothetical protein OHK93_005737 [Ramalina farinacea]|uniref:Uncharacterized protein n=1 Tax=Ramalina farinacea TaxID=258253 RepID=A0AA43QKC3_9LECA|nr:hypothetical protein [Ramalina farinacea]
MAGILVCCAIYFLALTVCILFPPEGVNQLGLWGRARWAKDNLQVSDRFSTIMRLDMQQDFFSSLLRTGFAILTAASEAVYLSEYEPVGIPRWTWLEEERLKQLDYSTDSTRQRSIHVEPHAQSRGFSGYGNAVNPSPNETEPGHEEDGVGHLQRGNRYGKGPKDIRVYKFLKNIFRLSVEGLRILVNKIWALAGFRPPLSRSKKPESHQGTQNPHDDESKDKDYPVFWMISEDGVLSRAKSKDVDVEEETRIRMHLSYPSPPSEEQISKHLYDWWRRNGWWGELDSSGTYTASTQDDEDDTTSLISMSTTNAETSDEESGWQSDPDSGRSTPTQHRPNPRLARSPSPLFDHGLDAAALAALLNPKDLESRQQAKILAHTLTATGITTRSRYQRAINQERTKLLTSAARTTKQSGPFPQEEEAELLESIIHMRRSKAARTQSHQDSESWASGGAACVVCQCEPRSVLVWPCRCLIKEDS